MNSSQFRSLFHEFLQFEGNEKQSTLLAKKIWRELTTNDSEKMKVTEEDMKMVLEKFGKKLGIFTLRFAVIGLNIVAYLMPFSNNTSFTTKTR